jgi:hypothetical protein
MSLLGLILLGAFSEHIDPWNTPYTRVIEYLRE